MKITLLQIDTGAPKKVKKPRMPKTREVGNFFWHTMPVKPNHPILVRGTTVEVEHPNRYASPYVLHFPRTKVALAVGTWVGRASYGEKRDEIMKMLRTGQAVGVETEGDTSLQREILATQNVAEDHLHSDRWGWGLQEDPDRNETPDQSIAEGVRLPTTRLVNQ
jgi:hypothetical protein